MDARRCFAPQLDCEEVLKQHYGKDNIQGLPDNHIFHGKLDVNVPYSHGLYAHKQIFQQKSQLHSFDHHGHLSLIMGEGESYIGQVSC